MSSDLDKVIDKIKKLLSLAGNNSSAAEATAAAGLASKLMDEYRLSSADIEDAETEVLDPIEEDVDYIYESGRITTWRRSLMKSLVSHYGCVDWNDTTWASGRKVSRYRLVGRKSDIQIVRYFFAYLTLECERLSQKEARGMGKVFANSYCEGFVNGIAEQLKASRLQAQAQASSNAIVKLDERANLARQELYKLHTNLKKSKTSSYSRHNGQAFGMGKARGQSVHLGTAMGTGSTTKMLTK